MKGKGERGKGRVTDNLKNINLLDGWNALYVRHRTHQIDPQSWTRGACLHWGTYISKRGLEQSTNITTFYKEWITVLYK